MQTVHGRKYGGREASGNAAALKPRPEIGNGWPQRENGNVLPVQEIVCILFFFLKYFLSEILSHLLQTYYFLKIQVKKFCYLKNKTCKEYIQPTRSFHPVLQGSVILFVGD